MHDEKALPPAQHEQSDVGMRFIPIGVITLTFSVVALSLVVLWLFPKETLDRTLQLPLPQFPQPRLQTTPRDDMAAFHQAEMEWLNSAGWIDPAKGVAHIPIAAAMRKVVEDKIPGWPGAAPIPPPVAQKETPQETQAYDPQTTERSHEAVFSAHPASSSRAIRGKCWLDTRSRRHCLRISGRSGAASGYGAARR